MHPFIHENAGARLDRSRWSWWKPTHPLLVGNPEDSETLEEHNSLQSDPLPILLNSYLTIHLSLLSIIYWQFMEFSKDIISYPWVPLQASAHILGHASVR